MSTDRPTENPSPRPTPSPTDRPTPVPIDDPTSSPTDKPTDAPIDNPTAGPTDRPSDTPSSVPTRAPTDKPTALPTHSPTDKPTAMPTRSPTDKPTSSPSDRPTKSPIDTPTGSPTDPPSDQPTERPTRSPTGLPTPSPSGNPTRSPTGNPSPSPTSDPSASPSDNPTPSPSNNPSSTPTDSPTPVGCTDYFFIISSITRFDFSQFGGRYDTLDNGGTPNDFSDDIFIHQNGSIIARDEAGFFCLLNDLWILCYENPISTWTINGGSMPGPLGTKRWIILDDEIDMNITLDIFNCTGSELQTPSPTSAECDIDCIEVINVTTVLDVSLGIQIFEGLYCYEEGFYTLSGEDAFGAFNAILYTSDAGNGTELILFQHFGAFFTVNMYYTIPWDASMDFACQDVIDIFFQTDGDNGTWIIESEDLEFSGIADVDHIIFHDCVGADFDCGGLVVNQGLMIKSNYIEYIVHVMLVFMCSIQFFY